MSRARGALGHPLLPTNTMLFYPGTPQSTHGSVRSISITQNTADDIQVMKNHYPRVSCGACCSRSTLLSRGAEYSAFLQTVVTTGVYLGTCSCKAALLAWSALILASMKPRVENLEQNGCIIVALLFLPRKIKESLECFPVKLNNLIHALAQMSVAGSAKQPAPETVPQEWVMLDAEQSVARATILGFSRKPESVCTVFFPCPPLPWALTALL